LELLAGESAVMRSLRAILRRVAASDSTVLVLVNPGRARNWLRARSTGCRSDRATRSCR